MTDRRRLLFSKFPLFLVMAAIAVGVAGCGGGADDAPATFEISGYINFDGEPVVSGMVVFENLKTLNRVACAIDDGYYESQANKGHKGGKFGVAVTGRSSHGEGAREGPLLWGGGAWVSEIESAEEHIEQNFDISRDDVGAAADEVADPREET